MAFRKTARAQPLGSGGVYRWPDRPGAAGAGAVVVVVAAAATAAAVAAAVVVVAVVAAVSRCPNACPVALGGGGSCRSTSSTCSSITSTSRTSRLLSVEKQSCSPSASTAATAAQQTPPLGFHPLRRGQRNFELAHRHGRQLRRSFFFSDSRGDRIGSPLAVKGGCSC